MMPEVRCYSGYYSPWYGFDHVRAALSLRFAVVPATHLCTCLPQFSVQLKQSAKNTSGDQEALYPYKRYLLSKVLGLTRVEFVSVAYHQGLEVMDEIRCAYQPFIGGSAA